MSNSKITYHLLINENRYWCGKYKFSSDLNWVSNPIHTSCEKCINSLIEYLNSCLDSIPKVYDQHDAEYAVKITQKLEEAIRQKNEIQNGRRRSNSNDVLQSKSKIDENF